MNTEKQKQWCRIRSMQLYKRGLLRKPQFCQLGLSDCKNRNYLRLEMHHEDYSEPERVMWLCGKCHSRHHLKKQKNDAQENRGNRNTTTVILLDKQIHWLDQLASTIRLNTKAAISRAELIRAAIAAIEESDLNLENLNSESEIKNFLLSKLKN